MYTSDYRENLELKFYFALNLVSARFNVILSSFSSLCASLASLENEIKASLSQREDLDPLTEFMNSFKSREEMQSFLDSFKNASVIRFPEYKLRLVLEKLEGREDKRVMISEIFHEVWEKLTEQTLDLVLKHLK